MCSFFDDNISIFLQAASVLVHVLFLFHDIRMREELIIVSETIKERNKFRSKYLQYDYLDPEFIPNSIAI